MQFTTLSRDIPLRDSELSKLANSTLVVKMYEGASRDLDEVTLLGTAEISVMDLLVDTALSGVFALELDEPPPAEPAEGEKRVRAATHADRQRRAAGQDDAAALGEQHARQLQAL